MTNLPETVTAKFKEHMFIRDTVEWGYGQMPISKILQQGFDNIDGVSFAKKVTGPDDDWNETTLEADTDNLFVLTLQ